MFVETCNWFNSFMIGSNHLFQREHKSHLSSCSAVLFQTGMQGTRQNILVEVLEHIANEPCFNQLRTKEQLGYIVFTGVRRAHGTQGIQFLVQSDRHPVFVQGRIDNYISNLEVSLFKKLWDKVHSLFYLNVVSYALILFYFCRRYWIKWLRKNFCCTEQPCLFESQRSLRKWLIALIFCGLRYLFSN